MNKVLYCNSLAGELGIVERDGAIVSIFLGTSVRPGELMPGDSPLLRKAEVQLTEYFAGNRQEFSLPLAPEGTEFEKSVWQALAAIPYGETRSYADIARYLGRPGASRAVGRANGRNPICIVIPCHRVIGANGKLTGYAGGLDKKELLLRLEGAL